MAPVGELLCDSSDDNIVALSALLSFLYFLGLELLLRTRGGALQLGTGQNLAVLVIGRGIAGGEGSCVSDNRRALKTGGAGLGGDDGVTVGFQLLDEV